LPKGTLSSRSKECNQKGGEVYQENQEAGLIVGKKSGSNWLERDMACAALLAKEENQAANWLERHEGRKVSVCTEFFRPNR
jgi:hypothetical protein